MQKDYKLILGDAEEEVKLLKDKSIKLMYGSPPYPNAKRDYAYWGEENYLKIITPTLINLYPKLTDDGFIVINIKSNRKTATKNNSSERSLIVEKLMFWLKEELKMYCVDIEIWLKTNPVPTGVRVACQDCYEYNLWFSKAPKWEININSIRREYSQSSLNTYKNTLYKKRDGVQYVSKDKTINANPLGALPLNVITGATSMSLANHQATQPEYLPKKYILACSNKNDIILDLWCGSGTTGVSAIKNDRQFIGIDISKDFLEIALLQLKKVNTNKQLCLFKGVLNAKE